MSGPLGSSQWMYNAGGDFYPTVIDQSLRFDSSAHLYRTATSGNSRTFTWSSWVKVSTIASNSNLLEAATTSGNPYTSIWIDSNAQLSCYIGSNGGTVLTASPKLRDPSAWYHIVFAFDTTQADNSNRIKFYINGLEPTYTTRLTITQNLQVAINTAGSRHDMGAGIGGNYDLDGYLADTYLVDGQALDPTSFGEFKSGVWIPKAYEGSYGTNGFHLEYDSNANDSSGTGNNWTATNIASTDYMPDTPTNNFCTLNETNKGVGMVLAEGALKVQSSGGDRFVSSTIGMSSGKWYFEYLKISGTYGACGIGLTTSGPNTGYIQNAAGTFGYISGGNIGPSATGTGAAYTSGDIIGVAFDADIGKVTFYKNNVLQAYIASLASSTYLFLSGDYLTVCASNFGQDSSFAGNKTPQGNSDANGIGDFYYAPPTGFLALCTANLPEPSISPANGDSPQDHFNTVLYTAATSNGTYQITGNGFKPDFSWVKNRDNVEAHYLFDSVRGNTNMTNKFLRSNKTSDEGAGLVSGTTITVNDDGMQVVETSITGGEVYFSGRTYVMWNWKASNATAVSNTAGTITSQVSANPTAGFSIVSYTGNGTIGATIGHGLSSAPEMMIFKNRSGSGQWNVYHSSLGNTKYMLLDTANAQATSTWLTNTNPSNSLFTLSNFGDTNASASTYIAYCFNSVEGYSKFGSYTGNGSADGTFVYTGFRPAWLLIKNTTTAGYYWCLLDNRRSPYNTEWQRLYPNDELAEDTGQGNWDVDAVSNGFKLRGLNQNQNQSGSNYIYMAFAENPFKYANAR